MLDCEESSARPQLVPYQPTLLGDPRTLKSNQPNYDWYRNVFKRRRKVSRDGASLTLAGRLFHALLSRDLFNTAAGNGIKQLESFISHPTASFLAIGFSVFKTGMKSTVL